MKLKNLLNELELHSGHFTKSSAYDVLMDFLFEDKVIPKSVANKIVSFVDNVEDPETKLPNDLKKLILSSGKKVYNEGNTYVIKTETPGNLVLYAAYNFDEPALDGLFFVGRLLTVLYNPTIKFSPQKQFKLNRVERIKLSEVPTEHRGKGYGSILYDSAMGTTSALYSDAILFSGSLSVWLKHIRRKSNFFGVYSGLRGVLLPIYDDEGMNPKNLKKTGGLSSSGFVSISKSVPSQLVKLQQFLDGINPHEVEEIIATVNKGKKVGNMTQEVIDRIEDAVSSEDLLKMTADDKIRFETKDTFSILRAKPFKAGFITTKESTIFVKEVGDELEWFLM